MIKVDLDQDHDFNENKERKKINYSSEDRVYKKLNILQV